MNTLTTFHNARENTIYYHYYDTLFTVSDAYFTDRRLIVKQIGREVSMLPRNWTVT